ncbi:hypothetical protein AAGS40_02790 [Paraburkholderia sp. PREW-6R]|uniref:hypothetical protein n=1 Tax=Paraburkholderia sp. PREW-6R TaxID=3141544 RepID=UPI0031F5AC40
MLVALASHTLPAFAQNNGGADAQAQAQAPAAVPANDYGAAGQTPANRQAARRGTETNLLGGPRSYGAEAQGNAGDDQREALLDTQRMTIGGAPGKQAAPGKKQRNGAAGNNGALNVAGQGAAPNAAEGMRPEGAAKTAYADPYAGKHAVYKSPW